MMSVLVKNPIFWPRHQASPTRQSRVTHLKAAIDWHRLIYGIGIQANKPDLAAS